jgi:hypothetical protein
MARLPAVRAPAAVAASAPFRGRVTTGQHDPDEHDDEPEKD